MSKQIGTNHEDYKDLLQLAISQIHTIRTQIARQINSAAHSVYWYLGQLLFEKQLEDGYGSGVVNQLSIDLKKEFPDMGLSPRNLWNMKLFYERYRLANPKLLQAVAVLPWGHNLLLINKIQSLEETEFYANEAITKGWSRDLLLNAIKMDSIKNTTKKIRQTHNLAINSQYFDNIEQTRRNY